MSSSTVKAELLVPRKGYGGKRYDTQGELRGHDGLWYRAKRGTHHHRVVKAKHDGRSEDISYRVRAADFIEAKPNEDAGGTSPVTTPSPRHEFSVIGQRGTITLSAAHRDRYGFEEGSVVIQEPREDGLLIRPGDVTPRSLVQGRSPSPSPVDLDRLLGEITPESLHGEVDSGPAMGGESL
jgi:hypothetical protein